MEGLIRRGFWAGDASRHPSIICTVLDRIEKSMERATTTLGADHNSLDLLRAFYRNPDVPLSVRMRAAIAALPFESLKLAVTATYNGKNFGEALERAIARSAKVQVVNATRMIEHKLVAQG